MKRVPFFCQKWFIKGEEVWPRGGASPYLKTYLENSPGCKKSWFDHISLWTGSLFGERVIKIALSPNRKPVHRLASYACVVVGTAYLVFRKFKHWSRWPKKKNHHHHHKSPSQPFLGCHATWGMLRDIPTNESECNNDQHDNDDDDHGYKRLDDRSSLF